MFDSTRADPGLLDDVDEVVQALVDVAGVDPTGLLLVGAQCRDVLHSALGHTIQTRATRDLDLAIALASWQDFDRLAAAFPPASSNGIGYRIAGVPVDIVPFGHLIESPPGVVRPATRRDGIIVFGFERVFDDAIPLVLPSGHVIKLPQPAGYALLKLRAWLDRRSTGDADDLALALHWYAESVPVRDQLYDDLAVLEENGFNETVASAHVLGANIRQHLSDEEVETLKTLITRTGLPDLAPRLIGLPHDRRLRAEVAAAFANGLDTPQL